jgi:ankyrin repeat protein
VDPNATSTEGWTPLMFAHGPGLVTLLEAGAHVNVRDTNGRTPLMWHALAIQDARVLLTHGADLYARNKGGYLVLASAEGHPNAIRALTVDPLLWQGEPPGTRHRDGTTRLMFAAAEGNTAGVRVELARGADVNARNDVGWTALIYAIRPGNEACVRALLDSGANVNAADDYGRTPLIFAALGRSPALFRMLLSRGADPSLRDAKGRSALTYARTQPALLRLLRPSARRAPGPARRLRR